MGLHPFGDPGIVDDFEKVDVPLEVREFREYAAVWTCARVTFHIDGTLVRTVEQSPAYPMQFMLGIYDFGTPPHQPQEASPKQFVIDWFRGYRAPTK